MRRRFLGALAFVLASGVSCGSRTGLLAGQGSPGAGADASTSLDGASPADAVAPAPGLRLIAPMSTSTVTSQSPTLRWTTASPARGFQIQVCRDRACRAPEVTATTPEAHAQVHDLAPGVHFWRVTALADGASETSDTWELFVGARSAPRDTAWGSVLDVNGDGLADVATDAVDAAGSTGRVYVFHGALAGLSTMPATTITGPDGAGSVFAFVANAADLDGDGFGDMAVGQVGGLVPSTALGKVYVYRGGPDGLDAAPWAVLQAPDGPGTRFGTALAGVGDVDGDGYGDLVVGAYDDGLGDGGVVGSVGFGVAYYYRGGPAGLTLATTLPAPARTKASPGAFGSAVAAAGDVDADGFADFVVSAPQQGTGGEAYVYRGGSAGPSTQPSSILTTATTNEDPRVFDSSFGNVVACAGDVDGDGYSDLLVTVGWTNDERMAGVDVASNNGRVYVYRGGPSGIPVTPVVEYEGPGGMFAFGSQAASAGDVDGDGYSDLLLGAFGDGHTASVTGNAFVYRGGPTGPSPTPASSLVGPDSAGFFGVVATSPGDVNGDGYDDAVVAAYEALGALGRVYVYPGSTSGIPTTPTTTLTGTDAAGNFGGTLAMLRARSRAASCAAPPG